MAMLVAATAVAFDFGQMPKTQTTFCQVLQSIAFLASLDAIAAAAAAAAF